MQPKKLIIALGIIILLVLIGIAIYLLGQIGAPTPRGVPLLPILGRLPFIGPRPGPSLPETPTPPGAEVPAVEPEGIARRRLIQISDEPVAGPAIDSTNKKLLYYRKRDGHLLTNAFTGQAEETVSNLTVLNILDVAWSPDRKRAILFYQDGGEVKKFITEATSSPRVTLLPTTAISVAWSPDGRRVGWLQFQDPQHTYFSADTDGKNQRRVPFTMPLPDLSLIISSTDQILLTPKAASMFEAPVLLFNTKALSLTMLLSDFGLMTRAGPAKAPHLMLYSTTNQNGIPKGLHLLDTKTGADRVYPLKTLAAKCAFTPDGTVIFCAVPKNSPFGLPEQWFQGKISFSDTFFRIKIKENKAEEIFSEGDYDAVNLVVSDDAKAIFFVDKKTGLLYGLFLE